MRLVQARRREKRAGGSSPGKISVEQAIRDGQSSSQGKEGGEACAEEGTKPRKALSCQARWWMGGRLSGRVGRKGGGGESSPCPRPTTNPKNVTRQANLSFHCV